MAPRCVRGAGEAVRALALVLLVSVGLLIGFIGVEVIARLLPRRESPGQLSGLHEIRVDRPWLYGLKPGVVQRLDVSGGIEYRINSEGFRDREFSRAKAPGAFRIVALGDSLTFGYGVALEDTWPKRVEAHLGAARTVPPIEVLDLGVSGYNPYVEAALFTDVGIALGPDLVVLQFCINDLNDPTLHFDASTIEQLPLLPDEAFPDPGARPPTFLPAPLSRLCYWSRACTLVRERLAPKLRDRWIARDAVDPGTIQRGVLPVASPDARTLDWLARQYGRIVDAARARGARLVVVIFPFQSQEQDDAPAPLQESLRALGDRSGWVTVDLLPAFRAAARRGEGPLFFDIWHPTAEGYRVASQALTRALVCEELVPRPRGAECDTDPP